MSRTLRRRTALFALPAAALLALVPATASAYPGPGRVTGSVVTHDPSMIRTSSGQYLLHATGGGISNKTSADRTAFSAGADAFSSRPSWWRGYSSVPEAWAPDISYHGGKYLMYYSVSSFGSNTSAIGLAGSTTGQPGGWSDHGIVHTSNPSSDYNAIDPRLFASYDTCCAGTGSTYKVKVGRATGVTGPYRDKNGVAMTDNGGTPVLESHGSVIGPGGQSIMKDADGDLIVYHYYDGNDNGTPKLGINLLNWSSGWPVAY
ncbi:arabinan endo-1,5-alpha-L-arabinosidase [Streptomyces prasinosporus]|uniref:Arabinan endo-1,5-alpha-L-arabinosidase n=1 Tax=Streptomyces prasinosporus TaxID=68256 RepID=A0ABP6TQA6_9ACTN